MSLKNDIIEAEFRTKGASIVQRDMSKISKEIAILTGNNKDLQLAKARLEAANKKYIAGTKKMTTEYKSVNDKIKKNNELLTIQKGKLQVQASKLKISEMSTTQLKKKQRELYKALDDVNEKIQPERYARLNKELKETEKQMGRVKSGTKRTQSSMMSMKQLLPTLGFASLITVLASASKELFNLSKKMQGDAVRSSVVLGDSYDMVAKKAENMAAKMGLTDREFIANTASAADLLVPLGFNRDIAADMAVKLQSLVGPLDEWTGGQVGATEVSNILTKALLGENEQLKQLGVAIKMDSQEFTSLVKQYQKRLGVTRGQAQAMAELELITRKSTDAQTAYKGSGNQLLRLQKSISRGWMQMKESAAEYLTTSSQEKIKKQIKELENLEKQFAEEELTLSSLLKTYDTLSEKKTLTKNEQVKLNSAIQAIGKIVPGAITEFNKYGEAIGINKDLIIEAREAQRLLNMEMKKDTIEDLIDSIEDNPEEIDRLTYSINRLTSSIQKKVKIGLGEGSYTQKEIKWRGEQIQQRNTLNNEITQTILKLKALGLTEEEVSKQSGLSLQFVNQQLADFRKNNPSGGDVTTTNVEKIKMIEFIDDDPDDREVETDMDKDMAEYLKANEAQISAFVEGRKQLAAIQKEFAIGEDTQLQADAMAQLQKLRDDDNISLQEYEEAKKAIKDTYKLLELEADVLEAETGEEEWAAKYALAQEHYNLEFEAAEGNRLQELKAKEKFENNIDKINKDALAKKQKIKDKEDAIRNAKLSSISNFGAQFAELVGQETALGKVAFLASKAKAISDIIISTQVANAKAVEMFPITTGQPWVTINTISGAMGVANVAKQALGFEEGGYTKVRRAQDNKEFRAKYSPNQRGFIDKPSLLVGEKDPEFVANGGAVKNTTVKPYLDVIDAAQRAGTIETLNLPAVTQQLAVEGRESGGYTKNNSSTNPDVTDSQQSTAKQSKTDKEFQQAMIKIAKYGISSNILLDEFEKKQTQRDRRESQMKVSKTST